MKKFKNVIIVLLLLSMLFLLTACGEKKEENDNSDDTLNYLSRNKTTTLSDAQTFMADLRKLSSEEVVANADKQMAKPEKGETIAIMHVKDYGDIKIKFFEDVAPKAVENFVTHAKEGYYDGVTFHRVIKEFVIQGGDPEGTGMGGESIWKKDFGEELDKTILPYRGSLCMASGGTGTNTIGSQFFITQGDYTNDMSTQLSGMNLSNIIEAYNKYHGALHLLVGYAQYTTFGQVIEGMDIVDKIASVQTDANDKPAEDVIISSIEITTME